MKNKLFIKTICVILATLFAFCSSFVAFAEDEKDITESSVTETTTLAESASKGTTKADTTKKETTTKSFEEQKAEIQAKLDKTNEKLAKLEKQSSDTQEYVDTLDEKIGYVNEELTVLENEATAFSDEINTLTKAIKKNKKSIKKIEKEVAQTEELLTGLNQEFNDTYDLYCKRMRALYISGDLSIIGFLLSSGDISTFLTRYEMVKNVSESDANLLNEIEKQENEINSEQSDYINKKSELEAKRKLLDNESATLKSSKNGLTARQEEIALKKAELIEDMEKSNSLLDEINAKDHMYSEYRNADQDELDRLEAEITGTIDEYVKKHANDKETTTKKSSTSSNKTNTNSVLNMTYPVPGHYTVSAGYPRYSNGQPHGGIDFPCPTGSNVVAAQSGTVIRATHHSSYGNYIMVYHGKDSKGRSIVTLYAHNSKLVASVGDTVKKGQKIAKSGSTGNSTGPHCHFEVRINGERVNPKNYLA